MTVTNTLSVFISLCLIATVSASYAKTDDNCTIEMKEVCNTDNAEKVCEDKPIEECKTQTVTVYHTEVNQECLVVPESVCEDSKKKHCEVIKMPVRKKILVRDCKEVQMTVCENMPGSQGEFHPESKSDSYENTSEPPHQSHEHDHNHDHCKVVLRETCRPVPEEKCENVMKNVTITESKEVCEMVSVKECEVHYNSTCHQTFQEVFTVYCINFHLIKFHSLGLS